LEFLEKISSGSDECGSEIKSFDSMIPEVTSTREEYISASKNWCYGYHKVDIYTTWELESWEEIYLHPSEKISDSMSDNEEKISYIFNKAKIACLI
jgi:hypothetical protein